MRDKMSPSPKLKEEFNEKSTIPIKKGYKVIPTLSAWDKRWGRYYYPKRTNVHYALYLDTQRHYSSAKSLLEKAREIEVGEKQNARLIFEEKFLDDIFLTVSKYILSYYMTLEYFVTEYLWVLNNVNNDRKLGFEVDDKDDLLSRIKTIDKIIKNNVVLPSSTVMILNQRDFLLHPNFRRIFFTDKNKNWKENLVGWFLSGEIEGTFEEFAKYLGIKEKGIEAFLKSFPEKNIKLTVKRGVVAKEQLKRK